MAKYIQLTTELRPDKVPYYKYPRPQLKRDSYISLNGAWDGGITVPFPLESRLSGYPMDKEVPDTYTYTRKFEIPRGFVSDRVILHIDAADRLANVYVNDILTVTHEGGYLPFEADITDALG